MTTYGCVCIHCGTPYLTDRWEHPFYCKHCAKVAGWLTFVPRWVLGAAS